MPNRLRPHFALIAPTAFLTAATTVGADVYLDPEAYSCREDLTSAELGKMQARVFAHKTLGVQRVEGEWWSKSRNPSMKGIWKGKDFVRGTFLVHYNSIESKNKVRVEIGACRRAQVICGWRAHYVTDFRENDGYVSSIAVWGAVVSIAQDHADLVVQIQDDDGGILREDSVPASTFHAVENEMGRLIDAVQKKHALLKDKC